MKKGILSCIMSKESMMTGNHSVTIFNTPHDVVLAEVKTGENVTFPAASRVFGYFHNYVCAVDDVQKVFRLSYAGIKEMGELIYPKTTTQTLLCYRDYFCGEGYTELAPIDARPARDWKAHQAEYLEQKKLRAAGLIKPRKRGRKANPNKVNLSDIEKYLMAKGINFSDMKKEIEEDKEAESFDVEEYLAEQEPSYHPFDFDGNTSHEHASTGWWQMLFFKPEWKKYTEKNQNVMKARKTTARKTTAKKTTAKKTTAKKTTAVHVAA